MVPLLLITQQLAYRKFLYIKQTLTGLHDKSAAWDGLGASFQALWDYRGVFIGRQRSELRAFRGVSLILLYLGGQWVLNLVAPNLLNIDTTLGNPLDVLMLTENITELVGSDTQYVLLCMVFGLFAWLLLTILSSVYNSFMKRCPLPILFPCSIPQTSSRWVCRTAFSTISPTSTQPRRTRPSTPWYSAHHAK